MLESMINKAKDRYPENKERTVSVAGNIQSFVFQPCDTGPWFWMTVEEWELNRREDQLLPPLPANPRAWNMTISELRTEHQPLNLLNERQSYCLTELQELARTNNIETRIVRIREKQKGWEVHPLKGLLQVLRERGWIDEGQLQKCTMIPATNDDGQVLDGAEERWQAAVSILWRRWLIMNFTLQWLFHPHSTPSWLEKGSAWSKAGASRSLYIDASLLSILKGAKNPSRD